MTEFAQDMTAIAAVLIGAAKMIEAITTCARPFKKSVTISSHPMQVWWRRIGWTGWGQIARLGLLMVMLFFGLFSLWKLSFATAPLTTGDAANLVLYTLFVVMGFYPPAGFHR